MRVAISAEDDHGLVGQVSPHFGRCPYFVFVDLDGQLVTEVEVMRNPCYARHEPGEVPAFIHQNGAQVILTGGMGGRAVAFFQQYGIEPVTGASGSVQQALADYLSGKLQGAGPCAESVEHGH